MCEWFGIEPRVLVQHQSSVKEDGGSINMVASVSSPNVLSNGAMPSNVIDSADEMDADDNRTRNVSDSVFIWRPFRGELRKQPEV